MKRLLPILIGIWFLLLSATEGWSADCTKENDRGDYATDLGKWGTRAEQGSAYAQYRLGCLYYYGKKTEKVIWQEPLNAKQPVVVPPNYLLAAKWFTLSAEKVDAKASYYLGVMNSMGQGVPRDDKTAVKWLTHSAEQGDADAQWSLGAMYTKGRGVVRDDNTAVKWYSLAANTPPKPRLRRRIC